MRRTLIALLLAAAVPAFAQQQPALEPIPEPPPMPVGSELEYVDPSTIAQALRERRTVSEGADAEPGGASR